MTATADSRPATEQLHRVSGGDRPVDATDWLPTVDPNTVSATDWLQFEITADREAAAPPEAAGGGRQDVRLLVSEGDAEPVHADFTDLPRYLEPGDLVVVNTSATMAASLAARTAAGQPVEVHLSTLLPSGLWLVELRTPAEPASRPRFVDATGERLVAADGATIRIVARYRGSHRLWVAVIDTPEPLVRYLAHHGRPIRYRHVPHDWPLAAYQTIFATEPGSAEMPSAARALTPEIVTRLVARGVGVTPIVLHTGVSSLEGHEQPYPERARVSTVTADRVNATRRGDGRRPGGRVVAVGTTVVRALETAADEYGTVHPLDRWTDVVITPERGVRVVDGLLTGWHEPEASHLLMLEAIAGRPALAKAYRAAVEHGYRWHEFGDAHLILPGCPPTPAF